ncbi:MAG: chemotaxis response regulator protein-glutamate methylesterase [Acidobacteria bacterium]|nr:chemotaxis response regulator protein-glutamate methylesterase [Acidobacteriota bacterium]
MTLPRLASERKIRVLIVDDSAIVRKMLSEALAGEPDIEVVGTAPDPFVARDRILSLNPDVLTLDIEMPRMDGVSFLQCLMQSRPMPVIVISSLGQASCRAAIQALAAGAVEVLAKPGGPYSVGDLKTTLPAKLRAAAASGIRKPVAAVPATPAHRPAASTAASSSIIAIGASTGGTEAIQHVLLRLPGDTPATVIVQHIPAGFSRAFANRLNDTCPMRVKEAEDGDTLETGLALVAPGNFHMVLRRAGAGYRVQIKDGPMVCYQRPAVDVLFNSVAEAASKNAVGVLLTGMGSDGARGLLKMRDAGARTIAQNEASCVVFGMPREAIRVGAAGQVLALDRVASGILGAI